MVICPIALAVGCKKCPVFGICPVKNLIGDAKQGDKAADRPDTKPASASRQATSGAGTRAAAKPAATTKAGAATKAGTASKSKPSGKPRTAAKPKARAKPRAARQR